MKWLLKIVKFGLILGIVGAFAAAAALAAAVYYLEPDLPDINNLRDVRLQVPLKVCSSDDKLIAEFGEAAQPAHLRADTRTHDPGLPTAEDTNFFEHPGVDYRGLLRAGVQLVPDRQEEAGVADDHDAGRAQFHLSSQKTYTRKLSEIFPSPQAYREGTEQKEIPELTNKICLGQRAYGVGAAARVYYGKPVEELDLAQTAMIAGLPGTVELQSSGQPAARHRTAQLCARSHARVVYINRRVTMRQRRNPSRPAVTLPRHRRSMHPISRRWCVPTWSSVLARMPTPGATGPNHGEIIRPDSNSRAVRDALDDYGERHGYGAEAQLDPVPAGRQRSTRHWPIARQLARCARRSSPRWTTSRRRSISVGESGLC